MTVKALSEQTVPDLSSMTIAQLKEMASAKGYTVTKTKKADIISEIESQM